MNALAAGTTFITTGAALAWVLIRRRRGEAARNRSRGGIPGHIPGTLPELLADNRQPIGTDVKQAAGCPTAEMLDAADDLSTVLSARDTVRARILHAAGLPDTSSEEQTLDSEAVLQAAPITDIAALQLLNKHVKVLERRPAGKSAEPVLACFYNPLHSRARHTALFTGRSGALKVPVCNLCEQQTDRGENSDVLLVNPPGGRRRPVPYYTLDDGYARTGFGAFAPLWTDIPDEPAAGPGYVARRSGQPSRLPTIATSITAVTVAGVIGAGLGTAGLALIAARSTPEFGFDAGAYTEAHPRERIERISSALAADPVYIDPSIVAALDEQTADELRAIAEDSTVPIRFVATSTASEDESGGGRDLLAARVAADLDAEGLVVVLDPSGAAGIAAVGYTTGYEEDGKLRAAADALPDASPSERAVAVAQAAADLDPERSAGSSPDTVEQPYREPRETGPWLWGVPLWNVLRGAAAGFFGSVFIIGASGLIIRAMRNATGSATVDVDPGMGSQWGN